MSKRLDRIAALIPDGRGIADVGTDHGYVPVMLAARGYGGHIIAADIREGPLQSAVSCARSAGVYDKIEFLLCDGLSGVDPSSVDTVVIAGMGGDTITGILDRDYWCADGGYTLILQPMTHQNVLRYWLINNEFRITHEELVRDAGTIYQILTAEAGASPKYSDSELFTGKYEQISGDPLFPEYLDGLITKFSAALAGMESGNGIGADRLSLSRGILNGLSDMRRAYNG